MKCIARAPSGNLEVPSMLLRSTAWGTRATYGVGGTEPGAECL